VATDNGDRAIFQAQAPQIPFPVPGRCPTKELSARRNPQQLRAAIGRKIPAPAYVSASGNSFCSVDFRAGKILNVIVDKFAGVRQA